LFSEVAVSPDGIYCRLARLKGEFSTVMLPFGANLLPLGASRKTPIF